MLEQTVSIPLVLIFISPKIMFFRVRDNRKNFLGESAGASFLGVKGIEEYIPKNRSFFPND